MSPRRLLAVALGLVLALGTTPPRAFADRATADFFAQRGDKAAKEKKWAEAQEHYQKALEEEAVHVVARVGLAEAFFGAGDRGAAVEAWRRAVTDAEATKPLPPAWTEAASKARKRLAELDAAGTALEQMIDQQVDGLLALAAKWAAKDPDIAVRAVQDALKLRPGHAKALALLEKMGKGARPGTAPPAPGPDKPPPPASAKPPTAGEGEVLFSGKDMRLWTNWQSPTWRVIDGEMVGEVESGAFVALSQKQFKGDFDVKAEAKRLESHAHAGVDAIFGISATTKGSIEKSCLVAFYELGVGVVEEDGPKSTQKRRTLQKGYGELPHPFDPAEWNTYEVRFRAKEVTLVVNGEEQFVHPRDPRDGGSIGLFIQNVKVAFRKVSVLQR